MNSRERVYSAVLRKKYDRIPRFFWVSDDAADILAREYNIEKNEIDNFLGNDILQTWLSINKQMTIKCPEGTKFTDEWGITWERQGYYNVPIIHPFADLDAKSIESAPFPDPFLKSRYAELSNLIDRCGKTHFIGADVSGTLFEPAYHLRGMEELMVDMATESDEADVLLNRLSDFSLKVALEAVRLGADWIWFGDDMGSQKSMLMSPDLWRKYYKNRMRRIIREVKSEKADIIIAYHSCGSIFPIIGDLAEIGVQVLNPIQESAANMIQSQIKELYGDRLTLMCGLDTQTFLLNSSPDEVYNAMKNRARALSEEGGYIAAVSHTIQPDIPVKNIVSMIKALDDLYII